MINSIEITDRRKNEWESPTHYSRFGEIRVTLES